MVSMSGEITLEKYLKFGWKILDRITVNSFIRVMMVDKLKPVARIEIITTIVNSRRIQGVLLRGLSTVCPFGSVMSSGLKILSNSGVFNIFCFAMFTCLQLPSHHPLK